MQDQDWILVKSEKDMPVADMIGHIFEIVSVNGKTIIAQWTEYGFENRANWRDYVSETAAYRELKLPDHVVQHITAQHDAAKPKHKFVDYWPLISL